ncbi:MAG: hypothetical protein HN952_06900 [Candidatus Cloacimonetes bacterium]|jgi:tetratricopeptide (TPR) repeat protein|nr:hypothetical protein [Candidatus Cloacimonadota bacterium]MBT6994662.1 hypothetical protein [Candidatus Cloacimonadota bacterium]MBT7469107.1 hypothetical protein [Candidatus Cloacimonadota bacterium]
MKKILIVAMILVTFGIIAKELNFTEIKEAYTKSYEYETLEKYDYAIKSLNKVQKNYADEYTINYRLGWLHYLHGKYSNALEYLGKALVVNSYSVEALNTKNLVHIAQKEWQKSEELSAKIIEIDYYNVSANYWYSYSLKMQKKYDLAIKIDRKMLVIFPTSAIFLQELAENLNLNNKSEESYLIFSGLLILDPTNQSAIAFFENLEKKD